MQNSFLIGLAAITFAVVSWGFQLPVAKDAFAVIDPYHLTTIRFFGALFCLCLLLAYREGWKAFSFGGRGLQLSIIGIIGMCASPVLVFIGMQMSRAEHAVIIVSLQPTITAIVLWLSGKQKPTLITIACIGAALVGVILVVTKGTFAIHETSGVLIGDLIVLLGAAAWVIYSLSASKFNDLSTWRLTVLTMIPGCLATLAITLAVSASGKITTPDLSALRGVGIELAYLTFIGVFAAMLAWNFGLRRVGALNATLLINLMPVTAFAYRAWQGVRFEPAELFGVALVVSALVTNNFAQRRQLALAS